MSERPPNLEPSWLEVLADEFPKPHMVDLKAFLQEEKQRFTVYPAGKDIFRAFWLTPFDKVRVVILGQDPYHGPNQAHGLCFSVQRTIRPPPSLQNIFWELNRRRDHLVFVLWGKPAQAKASMIDRQRHVVLTAPHPSPYSANTGFFGCGHFEAINQHLVAGGEPPIDGSLPD